MRQDWSNDLGQLIAHEYPILHESGVFSGATWTQYADTLERCIPDVRTLTILDFGCGQGGGLALRYPKVVPYDPFVKQYSAEPWGRAIDVFFSADVFEHLPVHQVRSILKTALRVPPQWFFLAISTRAANKRFSNGVNLHLTVEPAAWWQGFLEARLPDYELTHAHEDLREAAGVFCFKRRR